MSGCTRDAAISCWTSKGGYARGGCSYADVITLKVDRVARMKGGQLTFFDSRCVREQMVATTVNWLTTGYVLMPAFALRVDSRQWRGGSTPLRNRWLSDPAR